jgi:hypothetical protein
MHTSIRKTLVISATAYEGLALPRFRQRELLQNACWFKLPHMRVSGFSSPHMRVSGMRAAAERLLVQKYLLTSTKVLAWRNEKSVVRGVFPS